MSDGEQVTRRERFRESNGLGKSGRSERGQRVQGDAGGGV